MKNTAKILWLSQKRFFQNKVSNIIDTLLEEDVKRADAEEKKKALERIKRSTQ